MGSRFFRAFLMVLVATAGTAYSQEAKDTPADKEDKKDYGTIVFEYVFVVVDPDEYYREVDGWSDDKVHGSVSLHYTPLGLARSFNAQTERDYFVGGFGVSYFSYKVDDGRMLLLGATASYALRIPQDDSTLSLTFVPVAVRVYKRVYFGVALGTTQFKGLRFYSPQRFKTVGAQVSLCMFGCK